MLKGQNKAVRALVLASGILAGWLPVTAWAASLDSSLPDDPQFQQVVIAEPVAPSTEASPPPVASDPPVPLALPEVPPLVPSLPVEPVPSSEIPAPAQTTAAAEPDDPMETIDFNVPVVRTPKIDRHVQFFSLRIRDRFEIWLGRLERHRPMVEQIFAEFNLPADLIFLSLVESGFSTNAVSRAKAVGPWQFIKSTAKTYGLRVDNWIDERRDPVKSTLAAAQYLRDLYQLFGSWPLAMAAYNAGERRVGRALIRARADDFWDLTDTKLLKRETREYVPRFLAAALIAKDPGRFGFQLPVQTPLQYEEVVLTRPVQLRMAAQAAGISYAELKALNPELRKDSTPPDPVYHLKVPPGSKTALLANLASHPEPKGTHVRYKVRTGDTLARLAVRYGTSASAILEANALTKTEKPKPGEWLLIPQTKKAAAVTPAASAKTSR